MKSKKYFIDNYLGIIAFAFFGLLSIGLLLLSAKGRSDTFLSQTLSHISGRFYLVLLGLGAMLTARTGMVNLSAMPVGHVLAAILFVSDFSAIAWCAVVALVLVMSLFFVCLERKWKLPLLLFTPMLFAVCHGITLIITKGLPIVLQGALVKMLGQGYFLNISISFLLSLLICLFVFMLILLSPLKTNIREQRLGKAKIPTLWAFVSQAICLTLGLLYVLFQSSKISSFQPNISFSFNNMFILLFFACCSQKLDNKIAPVLATGLGTFLWLVFDMSLDLLNINTFWQNCFSLIFAIGCVFLIRTYRVKGWYPMCLLCFTGLGGLPALGIGIYQKSKGLCWGEWQKEDGAICETAPIQ